MPNLYAVVDERAVGGVALGMIRPVGPLPPLTGGRLDADRERLRVGDRDLVANFERPDEVPHLGVLHGIVCARPSGSVNETVWVARSRSVILTVSVTSCTSPGHRLRAGRRAHCRYARAGLLARLRHLGGDRLVVADHHAIADLDLRQVAHLLARLDGERLPSAPLSVTSRPGTSIAATVAVTSLVRSTVAGSVWQAARMPTAIAATAVLVVRSCLSPPVMVVSGDGYQPHHRRSRARGTTASRPVAPTARITSPLDLTWPPEPVEEQFERAAEPKDHEFPRRPWS